MVIYFPDSNIAFMGDCFTSQHFKRDNESNQFYQNRMSRYINVEGFLLQVEYAKKMIGTFPENTTFVRGHGGNFNMADVKAFYDIARSAIESSRSGLGSSILEKGGFDPISVEIFLYFGLE